MRTKISLKKKSSIKELNELKRKIEKGKYKDFFTRNILGSNLVDLYFIHGKNIMNCSIISLKGDYMDKVGDEVYRRVEERYPNYYDVKFVPLKDGTGNSEVVSTHKYDKKEVHLFSEKLNKEICARQDIQVRERLCFDFSYEYGIGVTVYLNVDNVDLKTCNRVIKLVKSIPQFYEGEIFLGEPMSFKYKDCKHHKMIGSALDMSDDEVNQMLNDRKVRQ